MAPKHSLSRLLTLVLTYCCSLVVAAPWIVTDYYEEVRVTPYGGYGYYASEYASYVTTSIEQVSPTVTSLPEAISTVTSVASSYYADVTVIQKLYPSGIGKEIDPYNVDYGYGYSAGDGYHSSLYVVNLTYTAPTGCSSQWTTTTTGTVDPPSAVRTLLPLTATSLSTSVDTSQAFQPTTYIYTVIQVDPTQIPSASMDCLRDRHAPTDLYEGSSCTYQSHGCYYYDGYYDGPWYNDTYWYGISPLAIILICVLGWVGLIFILGIIEAWVRFRRLMTGWQTRRGLPLFWAFMLLPLSLFFLCCFRKGYRARNAADAAFLQQKWRDMSPWTKLRLFFIWGFRFKYPDVLGPAPPRVKVSKRPGKDASAAPLLYPQPYSQSLPTVQEAPEASGAITGDRGAPGAGPEMAEASTLPVHGVAPVAPPQHSSSEVSGAPSESHDTEIGRAR